MVTILTSGLVSFVKCTGDIMPSDVITASWLRKIKACDEHVALFTSLFPDGAPPTAESLSKAREGGLDVFWIAKHRILTPAVLKMLSEDTASWIRIEVAKHRSTPSVVLTQLAEDSDIWVRGEVARNITTPITTLDHLSRDGNSWVRGEVARNPSTAESTLERLAEDPDPVVQRAYASRPTP